jgi:hypothetical protein
LVRCARIKGLPELTPNLQLENGRNIKPHPIQYAVVALATWKRDFMNVKNKVVIVTGAPVAALVLRCATGTDD